MQEIGPAPGAVQAPRREGSLIHAYRECKTFRDTWPPMREGSLESLQEISLGFWSQSEPAPGHRPRTRPGFLSGPERPQPHQGSPTAHGPIRPQHTRPRPDTHAAPAHIPTISTAPPGTPPGPPCPPCQASRHRPRGTTCRPCRHAQRTPPGTERGTPCDLPTAAGCLDSLRPAADHQRTRQPFPPSRHGPPARIEMQPERAARLPTFPPGPGYHQRTTGTRPRPEIISGPREAPQALEGP